MPTNRKGRGVKGGNHTLLGLGMPAVHHALQILEKEAKYYSAVLPTRKFLIREAKKNLNGLMRKIQKSTVAHRAMNLATHKGAEVLSLLNFPNKRDVTRLNGRVAKLEQKLKTIQHRRARA
ncbi:MAG: hypothetical protein HY609_04475 [Deltaproteobacteria bacterium]|nr:hypothetical protein [Deltaproteobacteria bacterium]